MAGANGNGATSLRLRAVVACSFQRSEATNLSLFRDEPHYPGDLKRGEAFLFISKMGDQIVFIFRSPTELEDGKTIRQVVDSRRLRLDGGTWNPDMLQNYAEAIGLHLKGIKRFEQVHEERMQKRRGSSVVAAG